VISYWRKQVHEIVSSRALQLYGGFLALTHLLSAYFWMDRSVEWVVKSGVTSNSLCWPFLPACEAFRFSSALGSTRFLEIYALIAIASAGLFFFGKARSGFTLLLILLLMKVGFTSLSYGLMGNYHYMTFFVHLAFLFFPHKKTLIPFLIGIFYWGAGILKFDPEWLSGVALITPSFLPAPLQHASLLYAVILECILVFGLYSSRAWIRWSVLAQFILFHIFSWHIVGYFYPLTMFLLLSLFVLIPLCKEPWEALFDERACKQKSTFAFCAVLIFLQIGPSFVAPDPATSGAPRIFSLNMLDARVECETLLIRHRDKSEEVYDPFIKAPSTRTQCDPLVFLSQIQSFCADRNEKFDFWLQSRRTTQDKYRTRLVVKDVCSKAPAEILWAEVL